MSLLYTFSRQSLLIVVGLVFFSAFLASNDMDVVVSARQLGGDQIMTDRNPNNLKDSKDYTSYSTGGYQHIGDNGNYATGGYSHYVYHDGDNHDQPQRYGYLPVGYPRYGGGGGGQGYPVLAGVRQPYIYGRSNGYPAYYGPAGYHI